MCVLLCYRAEADYSDQQAYTGMELRIADG
jgi:hypothetical protein